MLKQIKYTTGAVAALAALSLGGAAIAGATNSQSIKASPTVGAPTGVTAPTTVTAPEPASQTDGDNIQSGDQTSPDSVAAAGADTSTAGDTTDTTSADHADTTGAGNTSETATANDGPGGHADEPGNANATTDQQGQN